jgi:hypothetical protein
LEKPYNIQNIISNWSHHQKSQKSAGIPHHLRLGREELERKVILVWRQCRDLVCDLFHLDPNFSSVVRKITGIIDVDGGELEPAHVGGKDLAPPINERLTTPFTAHSFSRKLGVTP